MLTHMPAHAEAKAQAEAYSDTHTPAHAEAQAQTQAEACLHGYQLMLQHKQRHAHMHTRCCYSTSTSRGTPVEGELVPAAALEDASGALGGAAASAVGGGAVRSASVLS